MTICHIVSKDGEIPACRLGLLLAETKETCGHTTLKSGRAAAKRINALGSDQVKVKRGPCPASDDDANSDSKPENVIKFPTADEVPDLPKANRPRGIEFTIRRSSKYPDKSQKKILLRTIEGLEEFIRANGDYPVVIAVSDPDDMMDKDLPIIEIYDDYRE